MGGPIRADCLGEESEKTGKGTGRERIWHSVKRQRRGNFTGTGSDTETDYRD